MALKYFWLKLPKDFFKRHDVRILETEHPEYLVILMKLMAESVDHEGQLRFSDNVPYCPDKLGTVIGHDGTLMRQFLDYCISLGLIGVDEDGTYHINIAKKMIGSETEWAKKKREQRSKAVTAPKEDNVPEVSPECPKVSPKCPTEKEIEKDIDYKKKNNKKKKYGEYKNVLLTNEQYEKLLKDWGEDRLDQMLQVFSEGLKMKSYKYTDHNLAIRKWEKNTKPVQSGKWKQENNFGLNIEQV